MRASVCVLAAFSAVVVGCAHKKAGGDGEFQAMQTRGAQVMGVDQNASTHYFDDFEDGGRIALVSNTGEKSAVDAIRLHLQTIAQEFGRGDFTNPSLVHDMTVPGATVMKAKTAALTYRYSPLAKGGEVRITTKDAEALRAVHEFLAFQRSAHHAGMDHSMMTHE